MSNGIHTPTDAQYRAREMAAFLAFRAALYEAHSRGMSLADLITVMEIDRPVTGFEALVTVIEATHE